MKKSREKTSTHATQPWSQEAIVAVVIAAIATATAVFYVWEGKRNGRGKKR